jgi:hypothetical protein
VFAHHCPGPWDHGRHQDHQVDRGPRRNEGGGEPRQGLSDDHDLAPATDGIDDDVRVLGEPGRVVVAGQVRGHHVVAEGLQLGPNEVPVPRAGSCPMDQRVRSHEPLRRYKASRIIAVAHSCIENLMAGCWLRSQATPWLSSVAASPS